MYDITCVWVYKGTYQTAGVFLTLTLGRARAARHKVWATQSLIAPTRPRARPLPIQYRNVQEELFFWGKLRHV